MKNLPKKKFNYTRHLSVARKRLAGIVFFKNNSVLLPPAGLRFFNGNNRVSERERERAEKKYMQRVAQALDLNFMKFSRLPKGELGERETSGNWPSVRVKGNFQSSLKKILASTLRPTRKILWQETRMVNPVHLSPGDYANARGAATPLFFFCLPRNSLCLILNADGARGDVWCTPSRYFGSKQGGSFKLKFNVCVFSCSRSLIVTSSLTLKSFYLQRARRERWPRFVESPVFLWKKK